jgi:hypothetical protein
MKQLIRDPETCLVRQNLGTFLLHRVELQLVEAQRVKDRWRDLRGEYPPMDGFRFHAGRRDHHRHIAVVFRKSAMLGELRAAGADDAVIGYRDEVGHAGVVERVFIQLRQLCAVEKAPDPQFGGVVQDIGFGLGVEGLAGRQIGRLLKLRGQPNQGLVVADLEAMGTEAWRARVGASEIAARSFGSIGDWPCLALTMISVDLSRFSLASSCMNLPSWSSTNLSCSVSAGPGVAAASR